MSSRQGCRDSELKMPKTCPVCKEDTLSVKELEPKLFSSRCSKCDGVFISAEQYGQWLHLHGENLPEKPSEESMKIAPAESFGAKFCPECKFMLMKYKVGHKLSFAINRCSHCGGMWFDKNEWEVLKSRNLHDDIHFVFSHAWQSAVRAEEHQTAMDEILRREIGDADLEEIRRIRAWLHAHPRSAELYAYLLRR